MSVIVNEKEKLFQIQTLGSSYQMAVDRYGVLLHLYYGRKIEAEKVDDLIVYTDMGFSGNPPEAGTDRAYSLDWLPQELPGCGTGDYRNSMLEIEHEDGTLAADFRYLGYHLVSGSYAIPGLPALYDTEDEPGETLIIQMKDRASDIEVDLLYGVFEKENIITRAARIINHGDRSIVVRKALSMSMDMFPENYDLICFAGRHAMERELQRTPLRRAGIEFGSIRGTSSHHYNPSFILADRNTDEESGDCFGFCLAYSGNFIVEAQQDQRNQIRVQTGIHPFQFSFVLNRGETFDTPQVIMSYSDQGLGILSCQYHDILREHMIRGKYKHSARPVLINSWEAAYMNFDSEMLLQFARNAADLGIEMMVLDDGWFGARNDDNCALGDWKANEKKLGGTLGSLSAKIKALGLKFGIWVEPEMISENSDLYRAHPDWAMKIPGREPDRARNQLVLDMTRRDVRDYLYQSLSEVISESSADYLKWDMNRSICDVYSSKTNIGEVYHRYVLGLYELMEKLETRFPDLLIEGCSGGGGRFDAGMLYYTPQIWCSDNTDAINRLRIQYGTSFFYPIGSMGAHVSTCPNHQTGRIVPFSTRADVAMAGTFGYELDPAKLSEEERNRIPEQIARYHRYADIVREGTYYRLSSPYDAETAETAWEIVSNDRNQAVVFAVMKESEGNPVPTYIHLKGLDPDKNYQCRSTGKIRKGSTWMNAGIVMELPFFQYESRHIEFNAVASQE